MRPPGVTIQRSRFMSRSSKVRTMAVAVFAAAPLAVTGAASSAGLAATAFVATGGIAGAVRARDGASHVPDASDDGGLRGQLRHRLLLAGAVPEGLQPRPALRQWLDRQGQDDRHHRLFRYADRQGRPQGLRQGVRAARPAQLPGHPAGRCGAALRPDQRRHGRLGPGGDPRHRDGSRHGARGQHPARGDAGRRDRGRAWLPRDREGRELRHQAPPRRCHLAELRRQ